MSVTDSAKSSAMAIRAVSSKMRITVGSEAINYSDPTNPVIEKVVAMGGRGISIFQQSSQGLELVWDSGSRFETELCAAYPNSHNAIQDEEFAAVNGILYNSSGSKLRETLDEMNNAAKDGCADGGDGNAGACPLGQTKDERSPTDGSGTEAIVAGIACGSLVAVTATEKSGVAFVWDITNITAPELLFVQHLSQISETKNPGLAYASRELGEIDPEAMVFLDAAHSPSGNAGVLFAGAWSGTVSFWEFECPADPTTEPETTVPETTQVNFLSMAVPQASFASVLLLLAPALLIRA